MDPQLINLLGMDLAKTRQRAERGWDRVTEIKKALEARLKAVEEAQATFLPALDALMACMNKHIDSRALSHGDKRRVLQLLTYIGNGDVSLVAKGSTEDVSEADLDGAAAGTFKRDVVVTLEDSKGVVQTWFNATPIITGLETVVDVDVGLPTIEAWADSSGEQPYTDAAGNPAFVRGKCRFILVADTDAGATKDYAAGDSYGCNVQVSSDDKWIHPVAALTPAKTFTVI